MARKQTVKLVKKKWYDIVTTGHFDTVKVGETLLDDANKIIGKPVAVNLMNLTGNYKQNQITLDYRVTAIEGDKGLAEFRAYRLSPSFIKRIVRRRSTRIDHSFIVKSADGQLLRIKPMIIARNQISTQLKNELRKAATISLIKTIEAMRTEEVLAHLLNLTIQRDLKKELSSFCPIKLIEIRTIEKVKSGTPLTVESVQARGFSTKKIRKTVKRAAGGKPQKSEEADEASEDLDALAVEEDDSEASDDFDDSEITDEDFEDVEDDDAEEVDDSEQEPEEVLEDEDPEDESEKASEDDGSEASEDEEPKAKK
jgi:small subunit ribosomal protein S3Ae